MIRAALLVLALSLAACPDDDADTARGYYTPPADGVLVWCPVSKTQCAKGPSTPSAIVESKTFYFCCPDCQARFAAEPSKYVGQ